MALKVAVGMSGGVDSSTAAWLLQSEGHQVVGITMEVFGGARGASVNKGHACYGPSEPEDVAAAREAARFLGIAHYTLDLREEYGKEVLEYFSREYLRGRTPNPCARCNPLVKFGSLLQRARDRGICFDRFATGHYARVEYSKEKKQHVLKRGLDGKKDQSYFLYGLGSNLLSQLLMPLGTFTKEEVRRRAEQLGLPAAKRKESQDFVEGGDYRRLFKDAEIEPGPIVDTSGKRLGTHRGIINYTVGQRRGLEISGPEPLYVIRIDAAENTVVAGPRSELFSDSLIAREVNFLCWDPPRGPIRARAQIRHNHKAEPARLVPLEDGAVKVEFESPQPAITPGQSVVFYDGDLVLGGGIIQ